MTFEDMDRNMDMVEGPPPEESSNRPFLLIAGTLAAFTLLALVCIAVYALYYMPRRSAERAAQINELNAQNTMMAATATQLAFKAAFTETPTATLPATPTVKPTNTPVVVIPAATTAVMQDPRTATVAALLTQAAGGQAAGVTRTPYPTALPVTGFADEVGIPGLLGLAILLIVVIFLSRRLRSAN